MRIPTNLLVTGGCGFIGSAFVRRVLGRADFRGSVVNLDLLTYAGNPKSVVGHVPESRHILARGDIADSALVLELIDAHRVDTIVHFAAESHVDRSILGPRTFIETNVLGTMSLLEAVRARPHVHLHHVSTDEVYGSLGSTGLFTEHSPYQPRSPYAASKAASDHLVAAWSHTYGISTTLSNCSNNYGPFQFPEKFIPLMILNMLEDKPLPVYGDGQNVRDWLYVDDHVDAVWEIIHGAEKGSFYNIGGNTERTNLELLHQIIDIVARVTGKSAAKLRQLIRFVEDRPGHDRRYAIDATRIKQDLGWAPAHALDTGLEHTVRWYYDNQEWIADVRSGEYLAWIERNYGGRR
jgi:dTDP-glucose 4,6-dehydratase